MNFVSIVFIQQWVLIAVLSLLTFSFLYLRYVNTSIMNLKLRSLNRLLIGFEFLMISLLIYENYILHALGEESSQIRYEQVQMLKQAQRLQQLSADLTIFARSYAATGNEVYRQNYQRVVDISKGIVPRPLRYDQAYWSLDPKNRALLHPDGPLMSLDEVFDSLPFTRDERKKLDQAKNESDDLIELELRSFALVEQGKLEEATALLYSQEYTESLQRIMLPIDQFFTMLDQRSKVEVGNIEKEMYDQFLYILAIFAFFMVGNGLIFLFLKRKINDPIDYITNIIRSYKKSDSHIERREFFVDEIGEMQREFFDMQTLIHERSQMIEKQRILLQTLLDSLPNPIFYKDNEGKFIGFNAAYEVIFGIDTKSLLGKSVLDLEFLPIEDRKIYHEEDMSTIQNGSKISRTQVIPFADGIDHTTIYAITGIRDQYGEPNGLIGTFTDITEMENTKKALQDLYQKTQSSIEYAALIQNTLIPDHELINEAFNDFFVIWEPKDTVGGDIYLFDKVREEEYLLMVIDCTGHGVAGAFVTMLVKAIERQITSRIRHSDEVVSPAKILSIFNQSMKHLLRQDSAESKSNAGFDGAVIYINKAQNLLRFAGAQTALFYYDDDVLNILKGDRYSVGYKKCDSNYRYSDHETAFHPGMQFYVSTDGYFDQCGGDKGFSFGKKRFEELIEKCKDQNMDTQRTMLIDELTRYQGEYERNDDITLVGFRL